MKQPEAVQSGLQGVRHNQVDSRKPELWDSLRGFRKDILEPSWGLSSFLRLHWVCSQHVDIRVTESQVHFPQCLLQLVQIASPSRITKGTMPSGTKPSFVSWVVVLLLPPLAISASSLHVHANACMSHWGQGGIYPVGPL
jgi:hypothetical protein